MKVIFIAYNVAIDEEVMEMLEQNGIESYTKWEKVLGKGAASGPHLGTHIWPASNSALFVATDDQKANKLLASVKKLRAKMRKEGIKAFVLPLDEVT